MKEPTNIAKVLINTVLVILICSCGGHRQPAGNQPIAQPTTASQPAAKAQSKPKTAQPAKPKPMRLTDDNVVAELTRYGQTNPETRVRLTTPMGTMLIKLFENTPLHRANFVHLVKEHFYDGTEFYRVIDGFMIQGGDSDDWERKSVKEKVGKYTIPAEFRPDNIHRRGAVSMVREYESNPEKRSSPYEFFIVQGTKYTDGELNGTEFNYGIKIPAQHREVYKTDGGCAYLDGQHTVFGQVISGLEVIDKIAAVKTDNGNWPIEAVKIKMEIVK